MREIIAVGLGGFIGSILRYKLGGFVLHHSETWKFPLSTFPVNVTGCLLIGVIAGIAERHHLLSLELKLFLITGVLGGYTTFSAFGYESLFLIRGGQLGIALSYVTLSVAVGLLAVWLGIKLTN